MPLSPMLGLIKNGPGAPLGTKWSEIGTVDSNFWCRYHGLDFGGGYWLAGSTQSLGLGSLYYSTDGETWTQKNPGTTNLVTGVLKGAVKWTAIMQANSYNSNTADPSGAWTSRGALGGSIQPGGLAYSPSLGRMCGIHQAPTLTATRIVTSDNDGDTWTTRTGPSANMACQSMCWSPDLNLFCAVSYSAGGTLQVWTSPDGITWTARTTPVSGSAWSGVVWNPDLGEFCAMGEWASPRCPIMTSPDGVTWTQQMPASMTNWNSYNLEYCGASGLYLSVGYDIGTGNREIRYSATAGGVWAAAANVDTARPLQTIKWNGSDRVVAAAYGPGGTPGTTRFQTSP